MKRGKLTAEQWTALVEKFESSSMEQQAFAAKAGVNVSGLQYWIYKLRRERRGSRRQRCNAKVSFVQVDGAQLEERSRIGGRIEVDLPSGMRIRFDASTEARVIGEVTGALSRC